MTIHVEGDHAIQGAIDVGVVAGQEKPFCLFCCQGSRSTVLLVGAAALKNAQIDLL